MTDWKVAWSRCIGWVGLLIVEILLLVVLSICPATRGVRSAAVPDMNLSSGDTLFPAGWKDAEVEPHELRAWFNRKGDPYDVHGAHDAHGAANLPRQVVPNRLADSLGDFRGVACLPQDSLVSSSREYSLLFKLLFDDLMQMRVKSDAKKFYTRERKARKLPTLDIDGSRRVAKVRFPSAEEERREAAWIERWEHLGKYGFLFRCASAGGPAHGCEMSEDEALEHMIHGHKPTSAVTDAQLKELWKPDALWREQNLPFVTIYIGATEYRVRTYLEDEHEGRATTYHVQIHVRPREVPS